MVKLGYGSKSTEGRQDVRYLGDTDTFTPQIELAKYLSLLGIQKKTQADDIFGGTQNARNFGYGFFGYNPFDPEGSSSDTGKPPTGTKAPAPPTEEPVTPAPAPAPTPPPPPAPPPPPLPPPPPGGPPSGPGDPPPAEDPPVNPPRRGVPKFEDPRTTVSAQPTPEQLRMAWSRSRA